MSQRSLFCDYEFTLVIENTMTGKKFAVNVPPCNATQHLIDNSPGCVCVNSQKVLCDGTVLDTFKCPMPMWHWCGLTPSKGFEAKLPASGVCPYSSNAAFGVSPTPAPGMSRLGYREYCEEKAEHHTCLLGRTFWPSPEPLCIHSEGNFARRDIT